MMLIIQREKTSIFIYSFGLRLLDLNDSIGDFSNKVGSHFGKVVTGLKGSFLTLW